MRWSTRGPSTWRAWTRSRHAAPWTGWWATRSSPLLWAKVKKGLSAGRVQSVATRSVVEREQEIEAFIPEEFWDVNARFEAQNAKGKKITCEARLVSLDGEKAQIWKRKGRARGQGAHSQNRFQGPVRQNGRKAQKGAAALHHLQPCSRRPAASSSFSTAETMQAAQELYEGVEAWARQARWV